MQPNDSFRKDLFIFHPHFLMVSFVFRSYEVMLLIVLQRSPVLSFVTPNWSNIIDYEE